MGRICESPGGQRWALDFHGLREWKDGTWRVHPVPEISAAFQSHIASSANPVPFLAIRQGCVLFLLPDRLMEFSADEPGRCLTLRSADQGTIGRFTGMAFSPDGGLWICGVDGAAKAAGLARNVGADTPWREFVPPQSLSLEKFRLPEPDNDGGITLIAESASSHRDEAATYDGRNWNVRPFGSGKLLCAWRGPARTYWAGTGQAIFQWDDTQTNWIEDNDISAGQLFDVALEPDGCFWLATSDGLIRGSPALWQQPEPVGEPDSPVHSMSARPDGRLYFVTDEFLHILENGRDHQFSLPFSWQKSKAVGGLFPRANAPLLVQAGDGLFQFQPEIGSYKSVLPRGERSVALGWLPDGNVCLWISGTNHYFEEYDGSFFRWKNAPSVIASDDVFAKLFAARNGDLWLGGQSEVLWRHNDQWRRFDSRNQASPEGAIDFAETADGKIYCATTEELWQFDGTSWVLQLRFNHINSLRAGRDGSLWLASNGGLFRYYKETWLENNGDENFPSGPVHAVCEDENGEIWAAAGRGLSVFHPEADPEPPKTFVRQVAGENNRLSEGGTLNLLLDGRDKWKFLPPWRLMYSYQLDQHDWSPFREVSTLSFPGLGAGRHYFQARAMDPAGNLEPVPATLEFTVSVPWFRELRLWVALTLGLGIAIFFAALALNRHRQLLLSHAAVEKKVAERTRELEIATRELLHSQKMNALGALAAGIAHDFNNILSIIKGSAQIIEDNTDQPEKIRIRAARIKTVVQQGAEIVDAMLGFSRGSDAIPAACDANGVVADTMKLLGDRFLREVEVKFDRSEKLPELFAPREFIQQILLNFIFNAAEAMVGKKEIILTTSVGEILPVDIFLAPAPAGSFVLISVRDIGGGIAPEIIPRIFEPFFTTKALSSKRGTGLGLSMVYELAKKMNAGLAVQTVVGRGSTFTLILPVLNCHPPGKE